MRPIAKCTLFCLVLALAMSAGATMASAKKTHSSAAVAVNAVGVDGATGQVSSADKACRAARHLTFYRVNSESSVPSGEPVASTWTSRDGSWSVPGPLYSSDFFATLDRKRVRDLVCEPATSNTVRVE